MQKFKILFIQETDWLEKGPQQQHHFLERMSNKGHQVTVFDYEILWKEKIIEGRLAKRINKKSPPKACKECNIHHIRPRALRFPVLNYFSLLFFYPPSILKVIRKFKPDVIMGAGLLTVSIGQILGKLHKIPYIHLTTDKWHDAIPEKIFKRLGLALESRLAKKADFNIVINEQLKEYEVRIGANPDSTRVIRAGVEIKLFRPDTKIREEMREKLGYSDDDKVLFFMGWLYTFSGLKEIVEKLAKHDDKKVKLCIVGRGELHDELVKLSERHQLHQQIKIIKWVTYRDLPKYVSVADICILPAYDNKTMNEIVPIKLYEYMAMEKPVITTQLQGITREFGQNNGVVYAEDPKSVFDLAISLIKEELEIIGKEGRRFIEQNCNWTKLVDEYENIVRDLVEES